MKLGTLVGLGPGHIVLGEEPVPPPLKTGQSPPPILAHVYCGQTAAWIKMPLGMEVGLGLGNTVLDGDPAPLSKKGGTAPNFRPMTIVVKRMDGSRSTLYGGRPRPSATLCYMKTQLIPQRGTAPNFWPMFIVAKRSPISATAEHLLVYLYLCRS